MLPWGTPEVTGRKIDLQPLIEVHCHQVLFEP